MIYTLFTRHKNVRDRGGVKMTNTDFRTLPTSLATKLEENSFMKLFSSICSRIFPYRR